MILELMRRARLLLSLTVVAAGVALLVVAWLVVDVPPSALGTAVVLVAIGSAALVAAGHWQGRRRNPAVMLAGLTTLAVGAAALGSGVQSGMLTGDFEYWAILFALLLMGEGAVTVVGLYLDERRYLTPPADPRVT